MNEKGYRCYLEENNKREVRRTYIPIKDLAASDRKLEELLSKEWMWFLLPNNCANFAEEILQAGGANAGLYSNCPRLETFR